MSQTLSHNSYSANSGRSIGLPQFLTYHPVDVIEEAHVRVDDHRHHKRCEEKRGRKEDCAEVVRQRSGEPKQRPFALEERLGDGRLPHFQASVKGENHASFAGRRPKT